MNISHMTTAMPEGDLVEVVCTQPGPCDGMRMGYAIKCYGRWEAWILSITPNAARVMTANSRANAITTVVEAWNHA